MEDLKKRIFSVISKPHLAGFATVTDETKPWVRYVMPVASEDLTVRFATFVTSRKVGQFEKNPEVHLVCGVTDPENWENYMQIQGRAELVTDQPEKDSFWNNNLKGIFEGPQDPNFGVVIVKPYRIELYGKEAFEPEVWEAKE